MARTMHAGEVSTDPDLVRRLLQMQAPQWCDLPIARVASAGTDNALYRLGDELVVRMPRVAWAKDQPSKEHEWLPRLAPHLPLPITEPLVLGSPGEGYPWHWTVCRWLDGEALSVSSRGAIDALVEDLAAFLVALRALDAAGGPPAGEASFFRGCPLPWRDAPTRAVIEQLRGSIDTDAVSAIWEHDAGQPAWSASPAWVHGDLAPGNLLARDGRLAGVIDFGGLGVGDPAVDLVVAWNLLRTDERRQLRTQLGDVDEATWYRGRGWALSIALIQLPYYRETNPVLAESSRHVLAEILADPG